jgi:trimethylamine--corrinoid protein Co-methyltransferase
MDVIRQVGPGGNFLTEDHTVRFHQEEHWRPKFLNRDDPETWTKKGSKPYRERATQKAIEILETHRPEPLSEDVQRAIDRIAKEAARSLQDRHFEA